MYVYVVNIFVNIYIYMICKGDGLILFGKFIGSTAGT